MLLAAARHLQLAQTQLHLLSSAEHFLYLDDASDMVQMLDGQDVRRLGIPPLVKKDPNAKSRTQIKYRLAVRAWSEHMSRQVSLSLTTILSAC